MYNYGLEQFLQAKKLKSKECINAFLKSQGITDFTAINHNRVNSYIEKNWNKFSTFCDKGIKSGELHGKPVKLNNYYNELEQRTLKVIEEKAILSKDEIELFNVIKMYDDPIHLSKCASFLNKKGIQLPANNSEATSRALKILPKLKTMINSGLKNELIEFIKT